MVKILPSRSDQGRYSFALFVFYIDVIVQSDNGSEIGGYTRRLFDGSASEENKRKSSTEASATVTLPTDTIISLDDDDDPVHACNCYVI